MLISQPNEHGVLSEGHRELLASRGRFHATIKIALCDDGRFRYGLDMMYSYGGFAFPISIHDESFDSLAKARAAAIEAMLNHWPEAFPSEPASVHNELRDLREQVEGHLRQPSLF
ncbi:MAG: hypothetical protein KF861_01370 [Planctomycetaceae bacterium]|nr:hypothetical protein [Planctomycetaceae bacterium]